LRTVSALFDTHDQVAAAIGGLSEMGVSSSNITVIPHGRGALAKITEGSGLGAAIGGVAGLLAGLGMFVVPGLGSVLAGGWLVPVLICAAAGGVAGGIIGSLTGAGIDERDAPVCAEGVRCSGTLLVARVHDEEVADAKAILLQCGAIDAKSRQSEYAAEGWDDFAAKDIWDEDIGSEDELPAEERPRRRRVA
jgi:hypothetical protein